MSLNEFNDQNGLIATMSLRWQRLKMKNNGSLWYGELFWVSKEMKNLGFFILLSEMQSTCKMASLSSCFGIITVLSGLIAFRERDQSHFRSSDSFRMVNGTVGLPRDCTWNWEVNAPRWANLMQPLSQVFVTKSKAKSRDNSGGDGDNGGGAIFNWEVFKSYLSPEQYNVPWKPFLRPNQGRKCGRSLGCLLMVT